MKNGGLFITLYDEDSLGIYLHEGIYSFLMTPVLQGEPTTRSKHYSILADYASTREGDDVFFFLNREIIYAGKIKGEKGKPAFYLNGKTSPLGVKNNAALFWDESERYQPTNENGVFIREGQEKSQPFVIMFERNEDSFKYISSDELYFKLGEYPYPLMSNTLQGAGFCRLSPKEVEIALELISTKQKKQLKNSQSQLYKVQDSNYQLWDEKNLSYDNFINEAQLEYTLLADFTKWEKKFNLKDYVLCRQVPLCPFKPYNLDKVDICIYNLDDLIKDGTIPNIIIELKKSGANKHAVNQINKYLEWLEKITTPTEFHKIEAYAISTNFTNSFENEKAKSKYSSKIKKYTVKELS